jgi:hypothetical protein
MVITVVMVLHNNPCQIFCFYGLTPYVKQVLHMYNTYLTTGKKTFVSQNNLRGLLDKTTKIGQFLSTLDSQWTLVYFCWFWLDYFHWLLNEQWKLDYVDIDISILRRVPTWPSSAM